MGFTFNWHKEQQGFLKWMLVTLLSGNNLDQFSEWTDNFTNVELGITINGKPVDTKRFIERLEETLEDQAKLEAKEMLSSIPQIQRLVELLEDFEIDVRTHLFKLADKEEIDLNSAPAPIEIGY